MANKIQKTKTKIDEMLSERSEQIAAAEHDEALARDRIRQHTNERDAAAGTDPDKYVEMEKALDADSLGMKMAAARAQKLKETPMFSEDQFKKIRSVLYAELDDLTAATEKKLEAATLQMYADGKALDAQRGTVREILKCVFAEINKDGKRRNWNADTYSETINAVAWSKEAHNFYQWHKDNGKLHID